MAITNGNDTAKSKHLDALAETYSLPTASSSIKGGVKIGDGLSMNSAQATATPPPIPLFKLPCNNHPCNI